MNAPDGLLSFCGLDAKLNVSLVTMSQWHGKQI